jgi:hypothetical protein
MLLSLVSIACGELRISASTGDASGSSGYTETLGAKINDLVLESTALAGSSLSQSFKGSGDKGETFSVTNKAGDYAGVGFDIKNSNSYSGSYTLSPETAKYAQATEALNVNIADSIYAFASATTRDDYENAFLDLSITKGSLVGYANSAYATMGKASVNQKMKSASGESIWINEEAGKGADYGDLDYFVGDRPYSPNPNNGLLSEIQNGKLTDYSESATAMNDIAQPDGAILTGYSGSATATDKMAEKKRTISSFSANTMYWPSYAYNREGDNSNSLIQITNGQLSKYSMTTTATLTYVDSIAKASSAEGEDIDASGYSYDSEGDNSWVSIADSGTGSLKNLYLNPHATLNGVKSLGKIGTISGLSITDLGTAYNAEGDSSQTSIGVISGEINTWYSDNQAKKGCATKSYMSLTSAKGSLAEITSNGLNKALGYENQGDWNTQTNSWDTRLVPVNAGEGDFAAKKVNNAQFKNVKVTTQATTNDITISTAGFGTKTALILDPRRWEFEDSEYNSNNGYVIGIDIRDPIMNSLENTGYAVTYYSDGAVSKEKVGQMDDYWVSAINTHAYSYGFDLSKSSDGLNPDYVLASDLKYDSSHRKGLWKASNGMTILTICNTFTDTSSGTLADAASKASCSGGFASETGIDFSRNFLINYFDSLSKGNTALQANDEAKGIDPFDVSTKQLLLRGSKKNNFKL